MSLRSRPPDISRNMISCLSCFPEKSEIGIFNGRVRHVHHNKKRRQHLIASERSERVLGVQDGWDPGSK